MSKQVLTAAVPPLQEGMRIDVAVTELVEDLTRSGAQRLVQEGLVTVGGTPVGKNYRLRNGDRIQVTVPEPKQIGRAHV